MTRMITDLRVGRDANPNQARTSGNSQTTWLYLVLLRYNDNTGTFYFHVAWAVTLSLETHREAATLDIPSLLFGDLQFAVSDSLGNIAGVPSINRAPNRLEQRYE